MRASYIHVHSMRTASGHEVLVCRVLAPEGRAGFGFSFQLEATDARHMAMHAAGLRAERPRITPVIGHAWETAWLAGEPVPWHAEPAFFQLQWLGGTMGKKIQFKRPDGKTLEGYLAEPAQANAPGIVVIQEWWGLNDHIQAVADKLAAAGYRALVPDLYRGKETLDAREAEHLMKGLDFGDAASQDVRGAVQHLKGTGSAKVGVTGFCMGGALTILAAANVPEAAATVPWYGFPPLEYVDASKIKAPMLGHFATRDQFFKIEVVDELEKKLKAAGVRYEFHRYDADHAFASENADKKNLPPLQYDPKAAELAWKRTMEFFGKTLL